MENSHQDKTHVTDALTPFSDLRGLAVHDAQDLLTGHVFNVLTEAETGLIRFLDIELDGKGKHVLIPVGHARLEDGVTGRRIRLRAATVDDLEDVPAYKPAPALLPGQDEAKKLLAAHGRVFRGDRYYAHPAYDHGGLYAGDHPIVADTEASEREVEALELLSASREFKLASGEPDVRGWPIGASGQPMGTVADLVVDTDALTVRYVVAGRDADQTLLPIGYVNFGDRIVDVPGLTPADLAALPPFNGLPFSRDDEQRLLDQVERALDARNPFLRVDFSNRRMAN